MLLLRFVFRGRVFNNFSGGFRLQPEALFLVLHFCQLLFNKRTHRTPHHTIRPVATITLETSHTYRTAEATSMTATSENATVVPVKPEEVARSVWTEIEKLRDEIPPPDASGLYPDSKAADAFQAADQAVASLCAVPRDQMLEGFTNLVEGSRLNDLLNALVSSDDHPALQHSCLMVMCGVASLKEAHDEVTKRRDVLKSLLGALAKPKPHRISPQGAEEDLDVNPAVGAAICLNRYACLRLWVCLCVRRTSEFCCMFLI